MKKVTIDDQPSPSQAPIKPRTQDQSVIQDQTASQQSDIPNPLDAQIAELTQDLQRTRADFENYRKQVELQRTQAMAVAKQATVEKFLPLVDDFERAICSYPDQLAPLAKSFNKTLTTIGLQKIDSEPETVFNPDFHDAISIEDGDGDLEVIAETLRPGYLYDGAVMRPAMVKVKRISK